MKKTKQSYLLKTPGERLRYIRATLLRVTRNYIANQYGLSADTLRAWESNKQPLTENGFKRCMDIYRAEGVLIARDWILAGEGFTPKVAINLQRVFEEIEEDKESNQLNDEVLMLKEADFFKKLTSNSIIMLVTTEEMLPFYAPGDYIGGYALKGKLINSAVGKDCIVKATTGEQFFRRLTKHTTSEVYNLSCLNPIWGSTLEPVIYDVRVDWVAPVIWHRRLNI